MPLEVEKLLRLLDVGRSLVTELDAETVLQRILEAARDATDARYVALGVLNEQRTELERFLTLGIDDAGRDAIGDLPRGRGVLGVLIQTPRPLRLAHVGDHPQSYGFPSGHPMMESFLGVPIMIRGEAWGNLYLTDKQGGEFTEADETAAAVLADFAPRYWCRSVCHRSGVGPRGFDTPSRSRAVRGFETPSRPPGSGGRHA